MFWAIICIACFVAVCSEDSVGGLPRKPGDVSVNIKGVSNRQYYVNWQLSRNVSQPAGTVLNVSYSIRFHIGIKGWNCNTQPKDAIYGCVNVSLHITVDSYQFQCKVNQQLPGLVDSMYLNTHCPYNLSVIANNSAGQVESDVVFVPIPPLATPLPPRDFKAQATENQEIIVTWTTRPMWEDYKAHYIILYHTVGEISNRTSGFLTDGHQITLEDGIEAFTTYYVYMKVVLTYNDEHNNESSDMIGPEKVSTPEGEPNSPKNIRDIPHVLVDASFRNVTLEWEMPAQCEWRGVPNSFLVHYTVYPESLSENDTVAVMSLNYTILNVTDTSVNRTVIARLKSAQRYLTVMTMCNTKKCSAPGIHIIEAESMKKEQTQPMTPVTLIVLVTVAVAVVLLALIVGVHFYCKRFAPEIQTQPPLKEYDVEPSPAPNYQDIPVNNGNEYYRLQEED